MVYEFYDFPKSVPLRNFGRAPVIDLSQNLTSGVWGDDITPPEETMVVLKKEWQELKALVAAMDDRITAAQQIAEAASDQCYDAVRHIEAFEATLLEATGAEISLEDFSTNYFKFLAESNKLVKMPTVEEVFEAAPGQTVDDFKCSLCGCDWGKPHGAECFGHHGN